MAARTASGRYPEGTGWLAGFALGIVTGLVAWAISGEVTIGLVLFAATGTALGAAIQQSLDSRPLTPRERRIVLALLAAGLAAGGLVLAASVLFA